MEIIKTERLLLKPFSTEDTDFIIELLNTEGWIKNIGDRNVKTTEEAKNYLQNGPLKSYDVNGFGLYLVQLKETGTSIGMSGFVKRDYLDHPDIGFAFLPAYIGKGYAFEIATRIIEYGFMELGFEKILAITLPENTASVKLIERMGFTYEKNYITSDTNEELSLFYITKERTPADT